MMDAVGADAPFPNLRGGDSVLVIGGTGMLAPAVGDLLAAGLRVVLVSRRASGFAAAQHPLLVAVDADWADPGFAAKAMAAIDPDALRVVILWVHSAYRDSVSTALHSALPQNVRFVRLWGSGGGDPHRAAVTAAPLPGRKVGEVFLGSLSDGCGGNRWLSHREISDGTLAALRSEASRTVIGNLRAGSGL
ncbi:hypothetical protein KRX56_08490 [Dermabacteraceae bacterium TAE3-ERU27]|nr:hypothetical protein [Dermabacteraceae bacterium TAE3-ERU27]